MRSIYQTHLEAGFPWTEMLDLAPHLLWVAVALTILFVIGPSRIRNAFTKVSKIAVAGVEIEFKSEIEAAAKARKIQLSPQLRDQLARRLEHRGSLISGARVLWIDDHPENNSVEIRLLKSFGAVVDLALSNEDASKRLRSAVYDLVLSDMARGIDDEAGKKMIPVVKHAVPSPPLIFYVGKKRPLPEDAFGLTTRLDELLHLILDALERG